MYYMSMYVVTSNILTNSTRQTTYNVEFLYEIGYLKVNKYIFTNLLFILFLPDCKKNLLSETFPVFTPYFFLLQGVNL